MKFNINDLDLDSNIEVDRKKNERENVRNAKRNLEFRKKEVLKATYNQLKKLDEEIEKQRRWRDISRSTMYIIEWD